MNCQAGSQSQILLEARITTDSCQKEQGITAWLQRVILAARQLNSPLSKNNLRDCCAEGRELTACMYFLEQLRRAVI